MNQAEVVIHSIQELHNYFAMPDDIQHPLMTLIDYSKINRLVFKEHVLRLNLYSIIESDKCANKLLFGQTPLDFKNGTLVAFSPGQSIRIQAADYKENRKSGWGLYFHPDFIRKSYLSERIQDYSYFNYEMHEALHLSNKEKAILFDLSLKIKEELAGNIDKHSKNLVIASIDLILQYCNRFYDRQFITREQSVNKTVSRFKRYVKDYLKTDAFDKEGLTVQKVAAELNLSANYLSDLLKKETGKNAIEHIHLMMVERAKNKLLNTDETVQQIAFSLGFEYSQSFSKMFKNATGYTPTAFRNLN